MAGLRNNHGTQRDTEDTVMIQIKTSRQNVVGIVFVQLGELVNGEADILRKVRNNSLLKGLSVQCWRPGRRGNTLINQRLNLFLC